MVKGDWVKPGAAVIDVGINRVPAPEKGEGKMRLVGDCHFESCAEVAGAITPVPGGVGPMNIYRMYHEEMESLVKHIPTIKKAQFWMTFSDNYLKHLEVLKNVGMTRIDEVEYQGQKIVPLQFLKAVLPDPGSLGVNYQGKTCIGCIFDGVKDGKRKNLMIYNVCDHAECFRETGAQAVSYTTGVPAMIGAKMMLSGTWKQPGVVHMEQMDPDPFLADLAEYGLPWHFEDWPGGLA